MDFYVKVRHYGGGVSVISRFETKAHADSCAAAYNSIYQTNTYFVEPYDAAKAALWPNG